MDVLKLYRCVAFLLPLLTLGQPLYAGKLAGVRNATRGKAKATRSAENRSPRQSTSKDADDRQDDHADRKQAESVAERRRKRPAPKPANRDGGKLQAVLHSVRSDEHHPAPRPRQPSPQRPNRRAHRDRRGMGFYAEFAPPVCLPTVVEEHHYYGSPRGNTVEYLLPEPPPVVYVEQPNLEPILPPAMPSLQTPPEPIVVSSPVDILEPVQIRFEIDYAGDEADVDRAGFGLLMNATGGLGVDTGVRIFRESGSDFRDHLWLGDANLVYELFPTDFVRTRAGVGVNWLADGYGADAGFNLTVGTELFAGPILFSGEVDLGTLGDADLLHGRLTAALRQGEHMEWFAGYDYLDIGGTEIRGVVGGLRFRF